MTPPALHRSLAAPVLVIVLSAAAASAQSPQPTLPALTATQIVHRMSEANRRRAGDLRSYTELRHYRIVYRGFPHLEASMTVQATYTAPSTKTFRILSHSGPGFIIDRALRRLLSSEAEAARDPSEADIDAANYAFSLAGTSSVDGRPCYLLHADPRRDSKFLFRGTICVDAQDFAVAQVNAEPAKSPSFWIRKTAIHHVYARTGQFWLPASDCSQSDIRFGGRAVLTIDYGQPRIESSIASAKHPVGASSSRQN